MFQLWTELFLFMPLAELQVEAQATALQAVLAFGQDAVLTIGSLLAGRTRFGWGRGKDAADETQWVVREVGRVSRCDQRHGKDK